MFMLVSSNQNNIDKYGGADKSLAISHCHRGDLVGRTIFWIFFFSDLQKLQQRAKNCIELSGEYVQ